MGDSAETLRKDRRFFNTFVNTKVESAERRVVSDVTWRDWRTRATSSLSCFCSSGRPRARVMRCPYGTEQRSLSSFGVTSSCRVANEACCSSVHWLVVALVVVPVHEEGY